MKSIIVLGGGRIGSAIARDLNQNYQVLVADRDEKTLLHLKESFDLNIQKLDLQDKTGFSESIQPFDLVICAVPGFLGFETLKSIIEAKKNVVDISFFKEDAFLLNNLAQRNGVTAVIDCGVAPGLCNMMLGNHLSEEVLSYTCYVGGLPFEREKPFEYKAPFSPIDVIEEYNRPARMRMDGKEISRPALSDKEIIDFDQVGELEAFNTDGLRSLLKTTQIPDLKEKTLRYPGHAALMEVFREAGFFSEEILKVDGIEIRPIDLTSKLLFKSWQLKDDEREFTLMKVEIKTDTFFHEYMLFDQTDQDKKMSSMSRTTGFTCAAAARLILENKFVQPGIIAPEIFGADNVCFESVIRDLKKRQVNVQYKRVLR
jgi:saccharopine dehydrogenase-like NADP-dependent oxidoreductase